MTSPENFIYAALAGNYLLAISKIIAAVMTGSLAMLSEVVIHDHFSKYNLFPWSLKTFLYIILCYFTME